MKNSILTQALRIGIFLTLSGLLLYLVDRDEKQQNQINYNIAYNKRDSIRAAKSDSVLNVIYFLAVTNGNVNRAQDTAIMDLQKQSNR